jgi:hypothetical protein
MMRDGIFEEHDLNDIVALAEKAKSNLSKDAQQILADLLDLDKKEVVHYLNDPLEVRKIKDVGYKTAVHLTEFFKMLRNNYELNRKSGTLKSPKYSNENPLRDDVFIDKLKDCINEYETVLTVRARNALQNILSNGHNQLTEILVDRTKIRRLRNVGLKTEIELTTFFETILIEMNELRLLEKFHLMSSDDFSKSEQNLNNPILSEKTQKLLPYKDSIIAFLNNAANNIPTRAGNGIRKVIRKDFDELCSFLVWR